MTEEEHIPMEPTRIVVVATVGVIVVLTVVFGPLVPRVSFTSPPPETASQPMGTGSATIQVLESPSDALLEQGEFGAGSYYLQVSDARIRVRTVSGRPTLAYKIRIPDLGHARLSSYAIDESWVGNQTIALEPSSISPDKVQNDSYPGEILLIIRADAGERTILEKNVTVTVEQ